MLYNPSNNRSISIILKYLDYLGYNLEPEIVYSSLLDIDLDIDQEPPHLPLIYTSDNQIYMGEERCIQFYSDATLILHLRDKAESFDKDFQFYPRNLRKIKVE